MDSNQELSNFIKAISDASASIDKSAKANTDSANLMDKAVQSLQDTVKNIESLNESLKTETKEKEEDNKKEKEEQEKKQKLTEDKNRLEEKQKLIEEQLNTEKNSIARELLEAEKANVDNQLKTVYREEELAELKGEALQKAKAQNEVQDLLDKAKNEQEAKNLELKKEQDKKAEQETEELRKKAVSRVESLLTSLEHLATNGIDSVTKTYEQYAGKLSAALDLTVKDISNLQQNVAASLRDANLSRAISNVAVLNSANDLVSSGYTNVNKLESNAIDIAIGKEIAPNLDFGNATVKNLINVFGSDFTQKFAAIEQATQDTAGSTIDLSANLSKMMSDMEPLYLNATLQNDALQGTADVTSTLSAARDAGLISSEQENEYKNMLIELMDPSKAFRSRSTSVRVAATKYDYSSGSPAEALAALIAARQNYYGNVGQSSSGYDIISRALAASAAGESTFSAAYNPEGLTGLQLLRSGDLSQTYNDKLSSLKSGDYTTTKEAESNVAENSILVQTLSGFAKQFPIQYGLAQTAILTAINSLPSKLSVSLAKIGNNQSGNILSGKTKSSNVTKHSSSKTATTITPTESLPEAAQEAVAVAPSISSGGIGKQLSKWNSKLSNTKVGSAITSIGSTVGVLGASGVVESLMTGDTMAQKFDAGWENYAMLGAGIGTFGGPIGTLIGGLTGALVGLGMSLWASTEATKQNTENIQAQNELTKQTLGEGVEALTDFEAKSIVARGGGTIGLNSGTYKISEKGYSYATGLDRVPYDEYLAILHKDEAVVTASAAKTLRERDPNFWNNSNYYNDNESVVQELGKQTKSIVNAIKGEEEPRPLTQQGPKQYTLKNLSLA